MNFQAEVRVTATYWVDVEADSEDEARAELAKFDADEWRWTNAWFSDVEITDLECAYEGDDEDETEDDEK